MKHCNGKDPFPTRAMAERVARRARVCNDERGVIAYHCVACAAWHVGHAVDARFSQRTARRVSRRLESMLLRKVEVML